MRRDRMEVHIRSGGQRHVMEMDNEGMKHGTVATEGYKRRNSEDLIQGQKKHRF